MQHFLLRELRLDRCWSQRDLAERAGVTATTISTLEQGRQRPQLRTLRLLAEAFGIEPRQLWGTNE